MGGYISKNVSTSSTKGEVVISRIKLSTTSDIRKTSSVHAIPYEYTIITEEQKELLRESWKIVEMEISKLGVVIFLR